MITGTRRGGLLVFVLLTAACGRSGAVEEAHANDARAAVRVTLAAVQPRTVTRSLRVSGGLEAQETADIAVATPAIVTQTPVDVGDRVEAGGILLHLDSRDATLRSSQARAALEQAAARLGTQTGGNFDTEAVPEVRAAQAARDVAQANLERAERLVGVGAMTAQNLDQLRALATQSAQNYAMAEAGARQAHAGVSAARSAQQLASKLLGDSTVRAPFTGVISRRGISVGEWAAPGMAVLTLVSEGPLRLVMQVPESDVAAVRLGAEVRLKVPAFGDQEFPGTVGRMAPALENASRTLRVEATVPNQTGALRPGMYGTARISRVEAAQGLVVPLTAVRTLAGVSRVFVANQGHVEERIVVLGDSRDDWVEVTGSLRAGDRVAVGSLDRLADGVAITE